MTAPPPDDTGRRPIAPVAPPGVLPPRYRDAVRIGGGGMGSVYRAVDGQLGRIVAVKVIASHLADDRRFRTRFAREARAAARIAHPNVVMVHDVGEWSGVPYMVMEYCAGGSVGAIVAGRPAFRDEAMRWISEAAGAIDAGHAAGVVHRDIKPSNLLLTAAGAVKVSDFGVARLVDPGATEVTETGAFVGSSGYVAPEVLTGESATAAADVYALGVVAYELFTGGRPFADRPGQGEALAMLSEPVPPASWRGVGLPPPIDPVLARALSRDPAARHPTAGEFAAQLAQALETAPPPRRAPAAPAPDAAATGVIARPAATKPAERQVAAGGAPRRSRRGAGGVVTLVALAVLAGGGAVAYLTATRDSGDAAGDRATAPRATTTPGTTAAAPRVAPPPARPVTVTRVVTSRPPPEVRTVTRVSVPVAPPAPARAPAATTTAAVPRTPAPAPAPAATPASTVTSAGEAQRLTDRATYLNAHGRAVEAVPIQTGALRYYRATAERELYEGYADYNLGRALIDVRRCGEAVPYLSASLTFPGNAKQLATRRAALAQARACS